MLSMLLELLIKLTIMLNLNLLLLKVFIKKPTQLFITPTLQFQDLDKTSMMLEIFLVLLNSIYNKPITICLLPNLENNKLTKQPPQLELNHQSFQLLILKAHTFSVDVFNMPTQLLQEVPELIDQTHQDILYQLEILYYSETAQQKIYHAQLEISLIIKDILRMAMFMLFTTKNIDL